MAESKLDKEFIEKQREKLLQLQGELERIISGMEEDERDRAEEEEDTQLDSGDMSQQIFTREVDATVAGQSAERLEDVKRALEKIDEGTYGVCEDTGEPIPKGRLEAIPEALRTVEAEERRRGRGR
ncbi:DnaK suppressor protein [Rubrobacter radiotolerans]|uniref:DnaK suppressor protein n=1 Tax=Rubrobacter radiotolerans TaxID=42256 RepID=A0A023X322_RUBRA|nr:TraR/DksA C4-type zinc finger protein [Rubrobacter radiotolerans]AHY46571.1 DnaK suppressor protein [Rubrobacter radiotolerans]MDX5893978.1 TraR/DksA C4-type zinc finger protein [Rubrobacter radiotolerans]SMC04895.1 transcriptional regulator, TraR/DksA family [Rubrobacter radiotolerans DSM 5868]